MGFPIVNAGKQETREPAAGDVQFVTFTGNSVVTAVVSTTDGAVEIRLVEPDKLGKSPSSPQEFLELNPRVILKFPTFDSFDRFVRTCQGSQEQMIKKAVEMEAAAKEPGGVARRHLTGEGIPARQAQKAAPTP